MEQRISLITLGVSDLARACNFYRRLGWSPGNDPEQQEIAFYSCGGMILGLWDRARLADDSHMLDAGGWGGVTIAYNVASPAAVDSTIKEAREAGATIVREPAATFWGGYSAMFADPDGHPWEIAHNPFWTLHEDGSISLPSSD